MSLASSRTLSSYFSCSVSTLLKAAIKSFLVIGRAAARGGPVILFELAEWMTEYLSSIKSSVTTAKSFFCIYDSNSPAVLIYVALSSVVSNGFVKDPAFSLLLGSTGAKYSQSAVGVTSSPSDERLLGCIDGSISVRIESRTIYIGTGFSARVASSKTSYTSVLSSYSLCYC